MEIETTLRIYVGGLGETVTDEEIRNTFSKLGTVEAVDIVRTKGRSFAYVNFLPSSDKSLARLFSTYNGCSWKGGKLRLEKARQHYLDKLKAEWAEEAELANNKRDKDQKEEEGEKKSTVSLVGHKRALDVKDEQIRMFFPNLSKIKSLPYRGTGKHKYSFQRIDERLLPRHICDCAEHSRDLENVKTRQSHHNVIEKGGMNEDEISIMNSVMNKLINSGNNSKAPLRPPVSSKAGTKASEHLLVKEDDKDDTTDDDDNIVINTRHRQDDESLLLENMKQQQNGSSKVDVVVKDLPHNQAGEDDATDDDDNIVIMMGGSHNDERLLLESMKQQQTRPSKKAKRLGKSQDSGHEQLGVDKDKPSRNKTKLANFGGSVGASAASPPNRENERQNQLNTTEEEPESSAPRLGSTVELSAGKNKLKWKRLVDQKGSSSFTLSSLIPGGQSSKDLEHPEPDASSVPSDDSHDPENSSFTLSSLISGDQSSKDSEHSEPDVSSVPSDGGDDSKFEEDFTSNATSDPVPSESEQSGGLVSSEKQDEVHDLELEENVNNNVSLDPVSSQSKQSGGGGAVSSEKPARGASWTQKSSWTQLVGGGSNSGVFSISQVLSGTNLQKKTSRNARSQPSSISKLPCPEKRPKYNNLDSGKQMDMNVPQQGKDTGSSSKENESQVRGWWKNAGENNLDCAVSMEIDTVGASLPEKRDDSTEKKSDMGTRRPTVTISETCPFMRSASSLQDWKTTKEALSRSLRKKKKEETS